MLACGWMAAAQTQVQLQEQGYWRAASNTARSITGDIQFAGDKVSIDFYLFTVAHIRTLQQAELGSVFDVDSTTASGGNLYRVSIPGQQKFMHKSTLCSGEDTLWMVTFARGRELQVAFFSGQKEPTFTFDAMANATNACGTYGYMR